MEAGVFLDAKGDVVPRDCNQGEHTGPSGPA